MAAKADAEWAMRFTRLVLKNWRNFKAVNVALQRRMFLVGPNACGKSNLLDAFRFLRDVAEPRGGLARAVEEPARGGLKQLRSLHAQRVNAVVIGVEAELDDGVRWSYRLEFDGDQDGQPLVQREVAKRAGVVVLDRSRADDSLDPRRLRQTHLEQVALNQEFRPLADALTSVRYLHLVPELVRQPDPARRHRDDPFGSDFIEHLADTPAPAREARLRRVNEALKFVVPQLSGLTLEHDGHGVPHLSAVYAHWRASGARQTEAQFSDGTLRLLGLLWAVLDGRSPLLLEEPELSLHIGAVRALPQLLARATGSDGRQILLSTHSADLLSDEGIDGREVLILAPGDHGTTVRLGTDDEQVRLLLGAGLTAAEAILPRTAPRDAAQLMLFEA